MAFIRTGLKYSGVFLALWLLAQAVSYVTFTVPLRHYVPPQESSLPPLQAGVQRILIFSPHEDDETLATGGMIYTELGKGNEILVVFMTNGDGFWGAEALVEADFLRRAGEFIDFAHKRQREAVKALSVLGVPERDVIFLGYPDQGLRYLLTAYWSCDHPYRSPYTHHSHSPYDNSYTPGAPFCGASVLRDVEEIIAGYRPTIIYLPSPYDDHPDHRATGEFVLRALHVLAGVDPEYVRGIKLRAYIVHLYHTRWPQPRGLHPELLLTPPARLARACLWVSYPLSQEAERVKLKALGAYRTQRVVMGGFLASFVRRSELYYRISLAPTQDGGSG